MVERSSRGWRGVAMTPQAVAESEPGRGSAATADVNEHKATEEVIAA